MAGKQFELLFQLKATLGPNFSQSFKNASKTMAALQSDLRNADSKLKDVAAYQKQQQAVAKSKEKVSELQAEHERLTREIEESGQATPKLTRQLEANEKAMQKAKDATQREEERLNQLGNTLREAGVNTNNLGQNTEELRKKYERLEQTQKKVQEITEKQAANKQAIQQTKSQLTGLVGTVVALGTAIYAGPVKKAMEWQQQMQNVATLLDGDVKGRVTQLNKEVMNLSNSTGIGTQDLTDGLYQVVSAFGDSADASKQLEIAAKAAKAGGATTTDAINLLSAVTKGYGDTSAEAQQKAADLAFATVKLGQTSFPELASSMGQVIPLASTLGAKQEDLFGAMATLTGVTGGTSEVTTQLKATMQAFLSPSTGMQKSLEKLGYASGKEMLESEGLQGALEKLKNSVNDDELAFANLFSSVEAKNAVLALAGTQADNFTEKTRQMYEAMGAAETAFETATDSAEARMMKAKNSITNLGTILGGMLLPKVGEVAEKVANLATKFSEFAQKNPQTIAMIAKIAASLIGIKAGSLVAKMGFLQVKGGLLSIQKAFTTIKGLGFTKYLSSMGGGFGGIVAKISPLIGIITAVGGAIYYVSNHLEQVRGFIQKTFGDEGLAVFDKLWGIISQVGTTIKSVFFTNGTGGIFDTLKSVLPTIVSTIQTTLLPILPVIGNLIMQIISVIGQLISAVLPVLGQLISAILPVLGQLISAILPVIINLVRTLLPVIMQIVQSILPVFIQLFNVIVPVLSQIIQAILPVIINLIQTLLPIIMQIVQSVLPVFVELFNAIVPVLSQIIQTILPVIINLVQTILPIIMQIIDTVLPVFISLLDIIVPIFQNIVQAILPVFQEILQALIPVIQTLAEIFANVLGAALKTISNIIGSVMQVFQGLIDFVKNVFTGNWSQAWEAVKNIFSNVFKGLGEIFKAPFRAIVSVINGVIRGLNKLKIPDWVPIVGGAQLNIPEIPEFAKGTNKTPSTFIAGEQGPELITNAANRKVFTAAQTGQIFSNMAKAKNIVENVGSAGSANNVNMVTNGAGTIVIQVTNSPSVTMTGSSSGNISEIKGQLQQYDEEFLEKLREMIHMVLREQQERESRVAYG